MLGGGKRICGAIGALWAVAVSAAAIGVPAAAAEITPSFQPLTANIPQLAWRGEELRLVKCATVGTEGTDVVKLLSTGDGHFDVDWLVEDWSGYPFERPQLEPSTVKFFVGNNEYDGAPCVKATFVSLKAGLAQINLVITDLNTGNPVLKHQFLAGWLTLTTPRIRELGATTVPGGGGVLGDPSGGGVLFAGGLPGRVQVLVKGSLPLGNNFAELGLPGEITLPDEADGVTSYWDDLARLLATTSDPRPFYRDAPWRMWDIHDDGRAVDGHVNTAQCGPPLATIDAVDACPGAGDFIGGGSYSRGFGDLSTSPTYGPFDPLRPGETLLPDGKLDARDVPMPSALIEVAIAPNTGAPTDIGGVGSLAVIDDSGGPRNGGFVGVYKCIPYSRDHKCTSATGSHFATIPNVAPAPFGPAPHNHFAPYYSRWQPATSATVGSSVDPAASLVHEASGNDGPPIGNNFPGYRHAGLYDYWQFVDVLDTARPRPTSCLDRDQRFRMTPAGPQRVLVFSDEVGEAQVYFNPGTGFFFDNVVAPDGNGGCDLRGIDVLGVADISAVARYPYQKVTDPDKPSGTIRKVVRSLFRKEVSCVPKSGLTGPEAGTAFICTATAIDIDGTPFANERVCFTTGGTGAETIFAFPIGSPGERQGDFTICLRTNSSGQAQVEVLGKCGTGNVFALFEDERILRVTTFTFGCPAPPTTTTTTTTTTPATTTTPTMTTTQTTPTPPGTTSTLTTTIPTPTSTATQTTTPRTTTTVKKARQKDVCLNLAGTQVKIPRGMVKVGGKCLKRVVKAAKKTKPKPKPCYINGRRVQPCVRGKG